MKLFQLLRLFESRKKILKLSFWTKLPQLFRLFVSRTENYLEWRNDKDLQNVRQVTVRLIYFIMSAFYDFTWLGNN